jgi:hypothetical protein
MFIRRFSADDDTVVFDFGVVAMALMMFRFQWGRTVRRWFPNLGLRRSWLSLRGYTDHG